jgi:hypothetical protein
MDQQRRLVVYIGPPKTASTSLQTFLADHAGQSKRRRRKKAFEGWYYPLFMGDKNGIRKLHSPNTSPKTAAVTRNAVKKTLRRQDSSVNLVVASESLIAYAQILDDHLFDKLSNWTNVTIPEIVIQSRSPRIDHLISIWKQQTQIRGKEWHGWSFPQYMCSNRSYQIVRHRIGLFANPIGIAHDMVHKYKLPTYVMDMAGISQQGLDVSHAFACSIMKVNCTEGNKWVQGLEGVTVHANSRRGNPKLSSKQKEEIEKLFHQRDCAYRDELYDHSLFHLLYRHDGFWPEDCTNTEAMPVYRYNPSLMLDEIRRIIRCPGYESGHIQQTKLRISLPNQLPLEAAAYLVLALLAAILGMRQHARRKRKTGSVYESR